VGATANTTYVLAGGLLSGGGRLNANATITLTSVPVANVTGAVPDTRTVSAAGLLTGGGALSSNVTISLANVPVANVPGAVPNTVNVLASGLITGGGALTGNVTLGLTSVPVANVPGAVPNTVNVLTGNFLSGGGPLTGNVTLGVTNVPVANVPGAVPNTVNVLASGLITGGGALTSNVTLGLTSVPVANVPGAVPNTINIIAGTGLIGGGALTGNVTLIASGVPVGNITGLGTMATQNANSVTITGGNVTLTTATAKNFVANANIAPTSTTGAYSFGTLPYSDTNIYGSFQTDVNTYSQFVLHNSNAGVSASTDYVVSNDKGTAGASYGDFGINSSGFTGTGNFQKANAVYIYASSSDFSIGTWSSNAIHFIAGSSTNPDAMTINGNNTVTIQTLNQATSANATFATASLPLVPAGYIVINNNGTNVKIPYYAV
jgi:hypothetical protein